MRSRLLVLAPLALLALGGCASLSEGECLTANWEDIGYRDGVRGARRERAEAHAGACAEHGVSLDREAWQRGYETGLDVYCTPENAVQVGLGGGADPGVCPPESAVAFSTHWRAARVVHEARAEVAALESRRRELDYAWDRAESDQQRYNLRVELARVEERLRYARRTLYEEEARLDRFLTGIR